MSVLLIAVISVFLLGNTDKEEKIKWVKLEQLEKLNKKKPKLTFIDVYTTWCGPCKMMNSITFQHPDVIKYMNKNFYAVKLNAETRDTVTFKSKTYTYNKRYRMNDIAIPLANINGRMLYPTIVFMDKRIEKLQAIPGYRNPKQMMRMLTFFAEDHYKTTDWDTYQKNDKKAQKEKK